MADVAKTITKKFLEYMLKKATSELAMAFLGPLASMGVDLIFSTLFPPGKSVFEEAYKMMTKIVKHELQEADINHINGAISNIIDALQNEYTPRRKQLDCSVAANRQTLMDLLQKYDTTFLSGPGGMLSLLQQKDYQEIGLGAYILGVSIQIAIFQECTTVDPTQKRDGSFYSPLESSYGKPETGTVALTAKEAVKYVSDVWPKLTSGRYNSISLETDVRPDLNTGPPPMMVYETKLYDSATDKILDMYESYTGVPDFLKSELEQKRKEAVDKLTEQCDHPDDIIKKWQKLIEKPLNM